MFRRVRRKADPDTLQRLATARAVDAHRKSLQRVRDTLSVADETLADEIRRLDRIASGMGERPGL